MKFKTLATVALTMMAAAPIAAAPIELDLTFDGLTATFFGLDDAVGGSQQASAFKFSGALDSYNSDPSVDTPFNDFVFDSNGLLSVEFFDSTDLSGVDDAGVLLEISCTTLAGPLFACKTFEIDSFSNATVTGLALADTSIRQVTPVPLPAGGVLLLTGLVGVTALKRRKKVGE